MGIAEPPSGPDVRVLINGFEQPFPAVEVSWHLESQVDQDLGGQIRVDTGGAPVTDEDRGQVWIGLAHQAVG